MVFSKLDNEETAVTGAPTVAPPTKTEFNTGASNPIDIFRALMGMSRVIVAVFVLAHAGLAAIIATGRIPEISTIIVGSLACFFGTGALIGLNDLLDINLDRRRFAAEDEVPREFPGMSPAEIAAFNIRTPTDESGESGFDLGSLFIHHPVARGIISLRLGIAWVSLLSAASVYFIYLLKPSLWPIFFAITVFVVLYSVLGKFTCLKFLSVATAVTLGALAGWLTVTDDMPAAFWLFAAWTFLWEIGGRNVPNDFNDAVEDKALGVKTLPVVMGSIFSSRVIMTTLVASMVISLPLFISAGMPAPFIAGAILTAVYLLLMPAWRLWRDPRPEVSQQLYNRSAIYPLVLLILLMTNLLLIG